MTATAKEIDIHVGQRLRSRRESLGISQGQLGRKIGLTFSQVQKYEKGSNRIGAGRLFLLSQFLGVPIQYFFEELGGAAQKGRSRQSDFESGELGALDSAFMSIADGATRQSVLSLIRSLAEAAMPKTSANEITPPRRAAQYPDQVQHAGE